MDGADGAEVRAEGLGLKGPRGWVFRGVTLDAEPGSLIAIEGPSGSGRTCLLLALTGRMKPTEGVATVGGFKLPRHLAALRHVSAVANVTGVTDLEPALTVGEHLRERALLQRRFGDSLRALLRPRSRRAQEARLRVDTALAAAGLDLDSLPKGPRTAVRDLERIEELRLSVALALVGRPRLLGVDDVDMKLSDAERAEAWDLLRSLARAGTTVVAVSRTAPGDCVPVSTRPGEENTGEENTGEGAGESSGNSTGDESSESDGNGASGESSGNSESGESGGDSESGESGGDNDTKEEGADALTEAGRA
ncbi:ATP-binding cassette domain-containing protein [Streptomyces actinomycinicus]|uniref:ATP-binding cassette domain-containing protein n=1 Tax=Streptomyces actinomycinicus TaxID=1695166 RepID=UPI0027DA436B|nr:ATP-binding cassette domain-containing protein [Streptomyces actinomycinicus]